MIAEKTNELLRILEEKGLIEPEKVELERNPSPLPLSKRSVVQIMLQKDRDSGC